MKTQNKQKTLKEKVLETVAIFSMGAVMMGVGIGGTKAVYNGFKLDLMPDGIRMDQKQGVYNSNAVEGINMAYGSLIPLLGGAYVFCKEKRRE